jgi:DOPA 4,5-dioxygenase
MTTRIASYHAHIYYDPSASRGSAERLRDAIAQRFSVRLGRWHDVPVGPHPNPMFQVAFLPGLFSSFVSWLMLNRAGLTVLVHPNTGAPRDDHLVHALWLGGVLPLNGCVLKIEEDVAAMETEPNTSPTLDAA